MDADEYRCAACDEVFKKGWSDEEAADEAKANGFDGVPCEVVCDDCYKAIMAHHSATPEDYA